MNDQTSATDLAAIALSTKNIQRLIDTAQAQETSTHAFEEYIGKLCEELWGAARKDNEESQLQEGDKQMLVQFAQGYIELVPQLTNKLINNAAKAGIEDTILPAVLTVIEFFDRSPVQAKSLQYQLLGQAFFALRLFEDIHSQAKAILHIELVPTDLTMANIIVYQLIGEKFAAELDALVEEIAKNLISIQLNAQGNLSHEQKQNWQESWAHDDEPLPTLQMPNIVH